jgi:hypothetical protein
MKIKEIKFETNNGDTYSYHCDWDFNGGNLYDKNGSSVASLRHIESAEPVDIPRRISAPDIYVIEDDAGRSNKDPRAYAGYRSKVLKEFAGKYFDIQNNTMLQIELVTKAAGIEL